MMKRVADIDLAHPLNKVDIADEHIVDPDRKSSLKTHLSEDDQWQYDDGVWSGMLLDIQDSRYTDSLRYFQLPFVV